MKFAVYLQCVTRMKWLTFSDDPDSASGSIFNCSHNSKTAWQIYMENFVCSEPLSRKIHFGRISVTYGGITETMIMILYGIQWKHGPNGFLWNFCGHIPWRMNCEMFQRSWFCRALLGWWQSYSEFWGPSHPQSFILFVFLHTFSLFLISGDIMSRIIFHFQPLFRRQNETMCTNISSYSSTHCMSPSPPSPPGCSDHAGHGPHYVHAACQHDGPYHPADEPSVPGHYRKCEYSLAVPKRRMNIAHVHFFC